MTAHAETDLTVRGCKVRMMRGGKGSALLFLHGSSGAGTWLPFMDRLAERYDLLVPEHPGFGASDTPDWLDNIHDLAYYYREFIEQLGLDWVHLVGLSLGGWIAAELAVRATRRLATLTLVSAAGLHVPGVAQVDPFLASDEQRIRDFFVDQSLADAMIARLLAPEREDVNLKNRAATAKLSWQPRGHDPHLRKWLHLIDVPTLVLWGDSDKLFPKEHAEAYHRLIPGSRLAILPRCGHLPHIERTDAFIAALTGFIDGAAS